jgi:hypothetical protein
MPTPSTIAITYDGDDITNQVMFVDASFQSQAAAMPGTFQIRIKDLNRTLSFVTGKEMTFVVDDIPLFGGYLTQVGRTFAFPVVDTSDINTVNARIWVLRGVDYNILFSKRVFYNKADPLNHPDIYPAGTMDDVLIQEMCADYLDLDDDGIDFTTLVDAVASPNPDTEGAWVTMGSTWQDQMTEFARQTGAIWYINGSKQLVNRDIENTVARWGFSDIPNNRALYSGDQVFQGVTIGPRELDIVEDGTNVVNDALVWGGATNIDGGSVVFGRDDNDASIAVRHRWQYAEVHPNELNYLTEEQVQKRAEVIVHGTPGSTTVAGVGTLSRGLYTTSWNVSLRWFGHDVPTLGGSPNHLRPGDLVTFFFYALGTSNTNPLVLTLPLRAMNVSFPTLQTDTGDPYVVFDGVFSLQPDDPWQLWHFLAGNKAKLRGYLASGATAAAAVQGSLTPTPNGTNKVFTIAGGQSYVTGSTNVFINGLLQRRGTDYTESNALLGQVTFTTAPVATDTLWVSYQPR